MACAAMVYAAQNCLQSRFEVVSFGFSLKRNFVLTLQQTQGRWYNGVTYCRSSYIHDCIGLHMSGCYILVNNFVLRTVIPKYEQSYNTESGQRFLKVLLVRYSNGLTPLRVLSVRTKTLHVERILHITWQLNSVCDV